MMRVMLIVMGAYLVGCYAYGMYLLLKVYTGRRMNRRSVTMSHKSSGLTLCETSEPPHKAAAHADTETDQAKAA